MRVEYQVVQDEDDTWEVVAYEEIGDRHHIEAWGSFKSEAEALASIEERKRGL